MVRQACLLQMSCAVFAGCEWWGLPSGHTRATKCVMLPTYKARSVVLVARANDFVIESTQNCQLPRSVCTDTVLQCTV